jgi:SAM-dependent methyltransferase
MTRACAGDASQRPQAVRHPLFARVLDRVTARIDARGQAEHRRALLAGLAGRVVEIGAGNGANFAHYPAAVTEVVAVKPEAYLRERAREAAGRARVRLTVVDSTAERLPLESGSFDAGVASLVLCSVRDPAAALEELFRVIRPGGELRFYEHVRSQDQGLARLQRAADVVWPRLAGGCHTSRCTLEAIEATGFAVERCERLTFRPFPLAVLTSPHELGMARRPAQREPVA